MKSNRIIWGLVSLVVLITIVISIGTMPSHSQQETSKIQDNKSNDPLTKYAFTDYDAPETGNSVVREKRRLKNSRYDNQDWVSKNPHPDTSGVGRHDETPPPPLFPAEESFLVVVGKVVSVSAHLSNDKSGIYSEFKIQPEEILKGEGSKNIQPGEFITADRAGGGVRYPNGQKVVYEHSERDLLFVGNEYVFFLKCDEKSPNYEIITGYELKEGTVKPLNTGHRFDDFKGLGKQKFIEIVRNKIKTRGQE
jgi:hypothetical protein